MMAQPSVSPAHPMTRKCPCTRTLERRWFLQFFVGILACVANGACFCFGIISPFMKKDGFRYSQSQVNVVSTVGVLLSYFSLPTGYLYDHKGPVLTLLTGTVLNATGWLGMFFIFINQQHPLLSNSVAVMCIFYGLAQLSASFYETGTILTNLTSFSCYAGRVVLIQKTFMGLGSSLVVQIYVAFFELNFDGIAPFFFFLCCYSVVVGVLCCLIVRLPTASTRCVGLSVESAETAAGGGGESPLFKLPFDAGTGVTLFAIAFVFLSTMAENFVTLATSDRLLIGIGALVLCTSFILMVFITPSYAVNEGGYQGDYLGDTREASDRAHPQLHIEGGDAAQTEGAQCAPLFFPKNSLDAGDQALSSSMTSHQLHAHARGADYGAASRSTVLESRRDSSSAAVPVTSATRAPGPMMLNTATLCSNLRHAEIWLMWYVCFAVWSAATVISSNSSQIYQALAFDTYSPTVNTVFVSAYGVASAVGRVVVGAAQPVMRRRRIPLVWLFVVAPILNVIGVPMLLCTLGSFLFVPFLITGLATGISWGSTVLIVTSLYAPSNCGKHYSWLYTAGMLSPLVFNIGLFGPLYDHHSALQGRAETHACKGVICIWVSLLVCALVNVAAIPVALYFIKIVARKMPGRE